VLFRVLTPSDRATTEVTSRFLAELAVADRRITSPTLTPSVIQLPVARMILPVPPATTVVVTDTAVRVVLAAKALATAAAKKSAAEVKLARNWVNPENGKQYFIVTAWESYTHFTGAVKARRWSIWFEVILDLYEGDLIDVVGDLGTKVGKYDKDGKTYDVVEHSLTDAILQNTDTSKRRGGNINGIDQDDVRKYGRLL